MSFSTFNTFNSRIARKKIVSNIIGSRYDIISSTNLFLYYPFDLGSYDNYSVANYATGNPVFDASFSGTTVISNNMIYTQTPSPNKGENGVIIRKEIACISSPGVSFSMWFNPKFLSSTYYFLTTLQDTQGYPNGKRFYISIDPNQKITINESVINYTVTTNTWYHIVVTVTTSGSVVVYMNNVAYPTSCTYPSFINVSGYNSIARDPAGNGLIGYLDEYRLYNRIINASEAGVLYASGHS